MKPPSSKLLQSAVVLSSGQLLGYALSFLRNMLLARALTKADYGLASAFSVSVASLEFVSRMSFGQQIVQSSESDPTRLVRTLQGVQLIVGLVGATLLVCCSGLIARILNVGDLWWAFALLSAIPACMALENLSIYSHQREMRFGATAACELVPQLFVTIAAVPLIARLGDYRVILVCMIAKSVLTLICSHALAPQRYAIGYDRETLRHIVKFSIPVFASSMLMFAAQQADQLVVGAKFSMAELALYSVPVSLLMVPWIMFAKVLGPLFLSILSKARREAVQFEDKVRLCWELSAVATVLLTMPFLVAGEQTVVALFGDKYHGVSGILTILFIASIFRFLRATPTVVAMACGDTLNQLYTCAIRCVSLPLAVWVVRHDGRLQDVAWAAVIGEVVALIAAVLLNSKKQAIHVGSLARPILFVMACFGVTALIVYNGAASLTAPIALSIAFALFVLFAGFSFLLFPHYSILLMHYLRRKQGVAATA